MNIIKYSTQNITSDNYHFHKFITTGKLFSSFYDHWVFKKLTMLSVANEGGLPILFAQER